MSLTLDEAFYKEARQRTRWKWSKQAKIAAIRALFLEYSPEQRSEIAHVTIRRFLSGSIINLAFVGTWEEGKQADWQGWPPFKEAFDAKAAHAYGSDESCR